MSRDNAGYRLAHTWEALNGERIQRWPNCDDPRPVKVTISSWRGISAGAKHYTAIVEEEDNQWWCEEDNVWVELSCDSEKRGFKFKADVLSKKQAEEFVRLCLDFLKRHSEQTYEIDRTWD